MCVSLAIVCWLHTTEDYLLLYPLPDPIQTCWLPEFLSLHNSHTWHYYDYINPAHWAIWWRTITSCLPYFLFPLILISVLFIPVFAFLWICFFLKSNSAFLFQPQFPCGIFICTGNSVSFFFLKKSLRASWRSWIRSGCPLDLVHSCALGSPVIHHLFRCSLYFSSLLSFLSLEYHVFLFSGWYKLIWRKRIFY